MKFINSTQETIEDSILTSKRKAEMPIIKLIMGGILGGISIAIGANASTVIMHNISNPGLAKIASAFVFPLGLILIVMFGAELFTGNTLMLSGVLSKKIKFSQLINTLTIVFFSNFIGCIVVAGVVVLAKQFDMSDGLLGAVVIKNVIPKVQHSVISAFFSGILCNIIVCSAVFLTSRANTVCGKYLSIFFPIFAFVICGFEHCVANMYFFTACIFALNNPEYINICTETLGVSKDAIQQLDIINMLFRNLLPVTLGNLLGGYFISTTLYYISKEQQR